MSELHLSEKTENTTQSARDEFHWLSRISDVSGLGIILFSQDMGLEFINKLALTFFEIPEKHFSRNISYSKLIVHMAKRGDFGAGDSHSFVAHITDILNNQKAARDGNIAELKMTMPSGRRLLVRQKYDSDNRLLLTAKDITLEERDSQTLDIALDSGGSGFWYYNCETGEVSMHGDYLEKSLSRRQMDRLENDGVLSVVHPDDLRSTTEVWEQGLKDGKPWKHTCRILTGNGQSMWLRRY